MNSALHHLLASAVFGCALLGSGGAARGEILSRQTSPSDRDLVREIQERFQQEGVQSGTTRIQAKDGIVRVEGRIPTLLGRERSVELIQTIPGVRGIVNQLTVPAEPRPEADVRKDLEKVLENHLGQTHDNGGLDVTIYHGTAAMTGIVNTYHDYQLATRLAKSIPGVNSVCNELQIAYTTLPSDAQIAEDIRQRFFWDPRLWGRPIQVTVHNGRVTLAGALSNLKEKWQACSDAWTRGVLSVESTGITCADITPPDPAPTDDQLQRNILDTLAEDSRVGEQVRVLVQKSVATLTGTVETLAARCFAEEDALNTIGVRNVENFLRIHIPYPPADEEIQSTIWKTLDAHPELDSRFLQIEIAQGNAILLGKIKSQAEGRQCVNLISGIYGVIAIHSRLTLDPSFFLKSRHNSPPGEGSSPEERDLERVIYDRLQLSPYLQGLQIGVDWNDHVVTLSGSVHDISQYQIAERIALESGAKWVRNRLHIVH